eukprot:362965-Chlamydomonas_euryale.AAC.9
MHHEQRVQPPSRSLTRSLTGTGARTVQWARCCIPVILQHTSGAAIHRAAQPVGIISTSEHRSNRDRVIGPAL